MIPADGFYEWQRANGKQPFYFRRRDQSPLIFAGLWDHWQGEGNEMIDSCTIIVTEANELMEPIHDRLPVILTTDQYEHWLHGDAEKVRGMLRPYPRVDLETYPVSRAVNNTKYNTTELIKHQM